MSRDYERWCPVCQSHQARSDDWSQRATKDEDKSLTQFQCQRCGTHWVEEETVKRTYLKVEGIDQKAWDKAKKEIRARRLDGRL